MLQPLERPPQIMILLRMRESIRELRQYIESAARAQLTAALYFEGVLCVTL